MNKLTLGELKESLTATELSKDNVGDIDAFCYFLGRQDLIEVMINNIEKGTEFDYEVERLDAISRSGDIGDPEDDQEEKDQYLEWFLEGWDEAYHSGGAEA